MDIEYSVERAIEVDDLHRLFQQTPDMAHRAPSALSFMLYHSTFCMGAWQDDRMVGFVRVLTDDIYAAHIEDLTIDPHLSRLEIGYQLLSELLQRLTHVECVMLRGHAEDDLFLRRLGFNHDCDKPFYIRWNE